MRILLSLGLLVVSCGIAVALPGAGSRITCRDEKNQPVDWFVVYKLPREERSPEPLVQDGTAHYYLDAAATSWRYSRRSLRAPDTAVGFTLQQIYSNHTKDIAYVMYNDHGAGQNESFTYGHTKGDLAFDAGGGFWLVHSVPLFPPLARDGYSWPHNALVNGQTFLCVSFDYRFMEIIGQQFLYNHPWIYDWALPDAHAKRNPSLLLAIKRQHVTREPWNRTVTLTSSGGQKFLSFAKFTRFKKDLYADWVAPALGTDLLTETWQDGPGKLASACAPYTVENIQEVEISDGAVTVRFPETRDHSKWAVGKSGRIPQRNIGASNSSAPGWTCIGDINRQEHQKLRGGGTVCFQVAGVYEAFCKSVQRIEKCPNVKKFKTHKRSFV